MKVKRLNVFLSSYDLTMAIIRTKNIHFLRILRFFFLLSGIFFVTALILAFTTLPFWAIHWLGTSKTQLKEKPASIILLGGGGMPSESNLIRSWYAALAAGKFPEADLVLAVPGDPADSMSTPGMVQRELTLRGIDLRRIHFETTGTNTRAQALQCLSLTDPKQPVLLVTSPDHTRRAVLCFQKAGFTSVSALPAFENPMETDLSFDDDALFGKKSAVPDIGHSIQIRYQVWNHLKYEVIFIREMAALGYYKIRGWI